MNKKDLQKLDKLRVELEALLQEESDLYKKATEKQEKKIKIKSRKEGAKKGDKEEVKEKWLWEEVRMQGLDCEGGKVLKKKYPDVFKVAKKREKKNNQLREQFTIVFGFDWTMMTPINVFKMIESIVDFKIKENADKK